MGVPHLVCIAMVSAMIRDPTDNRSFKRHGPRCCEDKPKWSTSLERLMCEIAMEPQRDP